MRVLAAIAGAFVGIAIGSPAPALGAPAKLSAHLSHWQHLLGKWKCVVRVAGMNGKPETTVEGTLEFSMGSDDTLLAVTRAQGYSAAEFDGFNAKTKTYWATGVDSLGTRTYETSNDGKVYLGTSVSGSASESVSTSETVPVRDSRSTIGRTKIREVTEIYVQGNWNKIADAACSKS